MKRSGATWVAVLLACLQTAAGQVVTSQAPNITPRQQTLRVVNTAPVGIQLATLYVDNADRLSGLNFYVSDFETDKLVRLASVPNSSSRIRLLLKTSLESERAPSTKELYVVAVAGGLRTTATVNIEIVNPVSPILNALNMTGLIQNPPDVQTVVSNLAQFMQSLCNAYSNQSPVTPSLTHFRLFCFLFETVYKNLPPIIFNQTDNQRPAFLSSQVSFSVPENRRTGSPIGSLTATDRDGPQELTFSPLNGETARLIYLGEPSGQSSQGRVVTIFLRQSLDREMASLHTLYITATDSRSTTTAVVTLEVADVNDSPPVFSQTEYRFIIGNSARPMVNIGTVYATDPDIGNNAVISYSFSGLDPQTEGMFSINDVNGSIDVRQSLQNRVNQTVIFVVTATDGGGLFSSATVRVYVTDRNVTRDCRISQCLNGGTCFRTNNGSYMCYCPPGFNGSRCEYSNVSSDCRISRCLNGGTCFRNNSGSYRCYCPRGFNGSRCEYRNVTSDCRNNGCLNGGSCFRTNNGSYRCYCSRGFIGPRCEYRNVTSDCRNRGCLNGGTCSRTNNGSYRCDCPRGYFGLRCNVSSDCRISRCFNGGTCFRTNNGPYMCYCPPGFNGIRCEYRIVTSDCRNNGCLNGGSCFRTNNGSYRCYCSRGFIGPRCEYRNVTSDCRNRGCLNGGTCSRTNNGSYRCDCPRGYFGLRCNVSSDCRISRCLNGGTCFRTNNGPYRCYCPPGFNGIRCEYRNVTSDCRNNGCLNGGSCFRTNNGSYRCYCSRGFIGPRCEYRNVTSDCRNRGCLNGGTCSRTNNGSYRCDCPRGYFGLRCNVSSDCRISRCLNGGTCFRNNSGSYRCYCPRGFNGSRCEYKNVSSDCRINSCLNGGTCFRTNNGSYMCYCPPGFNGSLCEYRNVTSDCKSRGCLNGGTCSRTNNGAYRCYCSRGYLGLRCENRNGTSDCRNRSCQNGGSCFRRNNGSHYCFCADGYNGTYCEYRNSSTPCSFNRCLNGGMCMIRGGGQSTCTCRPGFTGSICERDITLRFRDSVMMVNVRESNTPGVRITTLYVMDNLSSSEPIYISTNDTRGMLRFQPTDSSFPGSWGVSLQSSLDREQQSIWSFRVVASRGNRRCNSTLIINVTDINDNSPVFRNAMNTATIDHDAVPGTPVMKLTASDADAGNNSIVYYYITGGSPESNLFHVHNMTGVISVQGSLLSFAQKQVQLIITAMDRGIPARQTRAFVFVSIRQGDGRLKFSVNSSTVSISESSQRGTPLIDLFIGPVFSGRRVSIRSNDTRGILSTKLTVATNLAVVSMSLYSVLDRETNARMVFVLTASDGVTTTNTTLILNITDVNDNAPVFTSRPATFTVNRLTPVGRAIGNVSATDPDAGRNGTVTFDIVGGTLGSDFFNVSSPSGVLRVNRSLAYMPESIIIRIRAKDGGNPSRQKVTTVTVSVITGDSCASNPCRNGGRCSLAANGTLSCSCLSGYTGLRCERESSLRFRQSVMVVNVKESAPRDTTFGFLQVDDLLQPSTGRVYLSTNDTQRVLRFEEMFTSATASWRIALNSFLDREVEATLRFSIVARLGNRSANATIILNVTDVNDNTPVFDKVEYSATVDNDALQGTSVVTIVARDIDAGQNGTVYYSITGGHPERSRFRIQNRTGVISVDRSLVSLTGQQIVFEITARDGGLPPKQASLRVIIDVRQGDGRIKFPERFTRVPVSESALRGYPLLNTTVYPVASGRRVSLTSNDTQGILSFLVFPNANRTTVIVSLNAGLDREINSTLAFKITAFDGFSRANTTLILNITDVNDNAPYFFSSQNFNVNRSSVPGRRIGSVSATDRDAGRNGTVTFDIVGGSFGYNFFNLSKQTGALYVNRSLFTLGSTVSLRIRAKDGGIPSLETYTTVSIQIVTGSRPTQTLQFNKSIYSSSVQESFGKGDFVTQIVLIDADGRMRGSQVSFRDPSLTVYADSFIIDRDVTYVTLRLNKNLRSQVSNRIIVNITAVVNNTQITANCTLVINIQRNVGPNRFTPTFSPSFYAASLQPNMRIGETVVTVRARDADTGLNGQVRYLLTRGNTTFVINMTTGIIRTNRSLIALASTQQTLTVVAMDNGRPTRSASATVIVNIESLPDEPGNNPPYFARSSYFFSVQEDQPINYVIGTVAASDEDGGSAINFRFGNNASGAFAFGTATTSGSQKSVQIMTSTVLDREMRNNYLLTVIATDGIVEATSTVTVQVGDVNDNAPIFGRSVYFIRIPMTTSTSRVVLTPEATDADSGNNGQISFRKQVSVTPDLSSLFLVERDTGRVVTAGSLSSLAGQRVEFSIIATDNGTPARMSTTTVQIDVTSSSDNQSPVFIGVPRTINIDENNEVGYRLFLATVTDSDGPARPSFSLPDRQSRDTVTIGTSVSNGTHTFASVELNTFLNRELADNKVFQLVASDGQSSATATVTIAIQDVNDNAPRFAASSYNAAVSSTSGPGTSVLNVFASDADQLDNGRVQYSIQRSNVPGSFRVDSVSGLISVGSDLSTLQGQTVSLRVEARDMGTPVLNASVAVTITIQSGSVQVGNNTAPRFARDTYRFPVTENNVLGNMVGNVAVSDTDGPQDVTLRVAGDTDADGNYLLTVFQTSRSTSWIAFLGTNTVLDREAGPAIRNVLLIASDGAAESTATVLIEVQDINDNNPIFTNPVYTATIPSSAGVNYTVIQTTATDADSDLFGEITYTLTTTDIDGQSFTIDSKTGVITTLSSIAGRAGDNASVIVTATDGGRRSVSVNVVINIT